MYQRISKLLLIFAMSYALLSCAISTSPMEQELINEGGTRLTAEQVRKHLAGKTQAWSNGGAYFVPDGTVYVKYEGRIYPKRTWTVDDNGRVCIAFPDGLVSSCSAYFYKDGEVWVVTLEIFGEEQRSAAAPDSDVREGNRLDELKWDQQI